MLRVGRLNRVWMWKVQGRDEHYQVPRMERFYNCATLRMEPRTSLHFVMAQLSTPLPGDYAPLLLQEPSTAQ